MQAPLSRQWIRRSGLPVRSSVSNKLQSSHGSQSGRNAMTKKLTRKASFRILVLALWTPETMVPYLTYLLPMLKRTTRNCYP